MATSKQAPAAKAEGPTSAPAPMTVKRDPRKLIHVYNPATGVKNPAPVPETWLDIFPGLKQTPTTRKKD